MDMMVLGVIIAYVFIILWERRPWKWHTGSIFIHPEKPVAYWTETRMFLGKTSHRKFIQYFDLFTFRDWQLELIKKAYKKCISIFNCSSRECKKE